MDLKIAMLWLLLILFHLKLFLYKRSIKISIDKILIIQNLKLKIKICCDPFQNQFAKGHFSFSGSPLSCPVTNNHFLPPLNHIVRRYLTSTVNSSINPPPKPPGKCI